MTTKNLKDGQRSKPNWCLSNFQSHIKAHFVEDPTKNRKLSSVTHSKSNLKNIFEQKSAEISESTIPIESNSSHQCSRQITTAVTKTPSPTSSSEVHLQELSSARSQTPMKPLPPAPLKVPPHATSKAQPITPTKARIEAPMNTLSQTSLKGPVELTMTLQNQVSALLEKASQAEERSAKAVIASRHYLRRTNQIIDTDSSSEDSQDSCEFSSDGGELNPQQKSDNSSGEC